MKSRILFFLILFLTSCSSQIDLNIDIEELKKDGSVYLENKKISDNKIIKKINLVKLYKAQVMLNTSNEELGSISDLNLHYFNNSNLNNLNKKNLFEFKKKNIHKKNILYHKNNLIFIDDYSNIVIVNSDFKIISKYKIYKNSFYEDYLLKFSVNISNDILYVADNIGGIIAYDIIKNTIIWRNNLTVPFLSNILIYNSAVYVLNANGKLYSFNVINGAQNWSFETGTQSIKTSNSLKISISNDNLIFSNDLGYVYCIDLTNKGIKWTYKVPLSNKITNNSYFKTGGINIEGKDVYISSSFGNLIKLNIENGSLVWISEISSDLNVIINPDTIFIVDVNGYFYIVKREDGSILYKNHLKNKKKMRDINFNNIYLMSNKFFLSTSSGYAVLIDTQNLETINFYKISNAIKSNIIILKNNIYFIGEKKSIYQIK